MVNVKDFNNPAPQTDKLEAIFERQLELIHKYDEIEAKNLGHEIPVGFFDLNDPKCQQRLKDFAWRITEEIGEAMNCLKNKPWKNTHMITDEVHYREELVDAFHFMVELLIHSGFTPETLVMLYLNKADVNTFRQRSNY